MTIYSLITKKPSIANSSWIADDANIIGDVILEAKTSIWFSSTLRGDNENILIGEGSNVQENTVMHTDIGFPLKIGKNCTIGHKALLHGCKVGKNSLIGMGSIILNGAHIGDNCLIGAGTLITEGKIIPNGSLVLGSPGKVIKQLSKKQIEDIYQSALHYQKNAERFRDNLKKSVYSYQ